MTEFEQSVAHELLRVLNILDIEHSDAEIPDYIPDPNGLADHLAPCIAAAIEAAGYTELDRKTLGMIFGAHQEWEVNGVKCATLEEAETEGARQRRTGKQNAALAMLRNAP